MLQRRVFERVEIPLSIKYKIVESPPVSKDATSKDISGGGVRLSMEEKIPVGAHLKLEIEIPGEKNKSTIAYGKVVWVSQPRHIVGQKMTTYYETGIQFMQADPISIGKIFKRFTKDT